MRPSEILKKIRADNFLWFRRLGICHLFIRHQNAVSLSQMMFVYGIDYNDFYGYSKNSDYPVKHPTMTPHKAFCRTAFKWLPWTQYGKNRMECLDWLIEQFEMKEKERAE